jgi:2-polyprenyl-3-methyl-5-hydroxy-6-metoxy-1,4-benzoquinol methylase
MSAADLPCPVCSSTDTAEQRPSTLDGALTADHLRITDDTYGRTARLLECAGCRFVFADPSEVASVVDRYAEVVDPGYEATAVQRRRQMDALLAEVCDHTPGAATLLDVGAGIGLMVEAATARGLDAAGVEPGAWSVATAERRGVTGVHEGVLPHVALTGRTFDVVTVIDVIEHVDDPVGLLRDAAHHLAPGGVVAVVTPDVGSVAARALGRRWWHYRPAHIGYFDRSSLERAAVEAGLHVVARSRARWWFPVGYLAERVTGYLRFLGPVHRRLDGGRLYDRTVRLNLFDSWLVLLEAR